MKKNFFGYNVDQVDDFVNSLQNQNDMLTSKIAKLTMQLSSIDNNNSDSKVVEQLNDKIAELEKAANAPQKDDSHEISSLKSENARLIAEIEHMRATSTSVANAGEQIGGLFGKAYSDIENMQREVSGDMQERVEKYANLIADYNSKMHDALSVTQKGYSELVNNFASQLDMIFGGLSVIEKGSQEIEKSLISPKEISDELKKKIDLVIRESKEGITAEKTMVNEYKKEEVKPISPIEELKEKYFKKSANGQVITVYTNVGKNDVYGNTKEV